LFQRRVMFLRAEPQHLRRSQIPLVTGLTAD
jgi:hypothetical protein